MTPAGGRLAAVALAWQLTGLVGAAPAAAGDESLVLTRDDVPGFKAAGTGGKTGRKAFAVTVRGGRVSGSAFRAGPRRLTSGTVLLRSSVKAAAALRKSGGRPLKRIGDAARLKISRKGKTATGIVTLREGKALAAVRLEVPAADRRALGTHAPAYAQTLAARLARVLDLTAWDRVLDKVRPDGTASTPVALQAFTLAYGDIPGVKRPAGPPGEPHGTLAARLILSVRERLTPTQRSAVDTILRSPPTGRRYRRAGEPKIAYDEQRQAIANEYARFYMTRLPNVTAPAIGVYRAERDIDDKTLADADAIAVEKDGNPANGSDPWFCRIRIFPRSQKESAADQRSTIAHEVFHCMQYVMRPTLQQAPKWITEGMAEWASQSAFPRGNEDAGFFQRYVQQSEKLLFERDYDAVGFWGRLDEVSGIGSLWPRVPVIHNDAEGNDIGPRVFQSAGATSPLFLETWASSMWRLPAGGPAWTTGWPYSTSSDAFPTAYKPVTGSTDVSAKPYQTVHRRLLPNPSAPFVRLTRTGGFVRLLDGDGDLGSLVASVAFCMGTCKCPPGTVASIPPHKTVSGPLTMAMTGGAQAATAQVRYSSAKQFCTDDPPRFSLDNDTASTAGDPHLLSFDGLDYDFQAAGEFVLVRAGADLEVQARQQPPPKLRDVTINTQLAMRVGGTRVSVSGATPGQPPVVRVDGAVEGLPAGGLRVLPGGGSVARAADGRRVTVTWADGSAVKLRPVADQGLSADVRLAAARAGKAVGLLGNFDGVPTNDLQDRSGRRISFTPRPRRQLTGIKEEFGKSFSESLYGKFGHSWRISQAESLFHYEAGQSTATFTDRSIPKRILDPDNLEGKEAAERLCREHGVTEPAALENCILDIVLTSDPAFADDAALAQQARLVDWTALAADSGISTSASRLLSTAVSADGLLHIGFRRLEANGGLGLVSVPIDAFGRTGAAETIKPSDGSDDEGDPVLFAGPGATIGALHTQTNQGLFVSQRANGTWSAPAKLTDRYVASLERPAALVTATGIHVTALTVSGVTSTTRVFVGTGDDTEGVAVGSPDCSVQSPALATEPASGGLFVAWIQSRCPQQGVYLQRFDPLQRAFVGAAVQAPSATWTTSKVARTVSLSPGEHLALAARPGQPGLVLAYPTDDGANIRVWRAGDPSATAIAKRGASVRQVRLAAEPSGGGLWLSWNESDESRRIYVQHLGATGAPDGPLLAAAPPFGTSVLADDFAIVSRNPGGVEILADIGGRIHHAAIRTH